MKKLHLLLLLAGMVSSVHAQNTFPATGNVGIGTTAPSKSLDIAGSGINLQNTTHAVLNGIIYKAGTSFISDFTYGNNGTVTLSGGNTFVGINAGNFTMGSTATSTAQASYNTIIGNGAFYSNITGYRNTALGYTALYHNTTGANNTAAGNQALYSNTTGNNNVAEGALALYGNQSGSGSIAIGYESLYHNTTGNYQTAVGFEALLDNTTGNYNVGLGYCALIHNTTGQYNTAAGYAVLYDNQTGSNNTAYGYEVLFKDSTGSNNAAFGQLALYNSLIGSNNTAMGYQAGRYIADGSGANTNGGTSVFIGVNTKSLTPSDNNEIVIGYNAVGAGTNSAVIGNSSIAKTLLQGNVLIGKTTQTNTGYKLDVNGDVRANKVVVNTTGADFVFDSTYHLPSLDSLQHYIVRYHHLPDMASARTMQQNGLSLGDAYVKLLQKMEETSLYLINLRNEIQAKDMEIDQLKANQLQFESKLSLLVKQLNIKP